MHITTSRKEKFKRRSLITKHQFIASYLFISTSAFWLTMTLTAFRLSILAGILCCIMLFPLVGWRISNRNVFTIFLCYFSLYPTAAACWILFAISFIYTLNVPINNSIASLVLLSVIPVFSLLIVFLKRKNNEFLNRAKKSLELLNALSLTATGVAALFAYMNSDFNFIAPYIDFRKLPELGFQTRDAFNYISLYLSFPFVISGAFCKFALEVIVDNKQIS